MRRILVERGRYFDSVFLMRIGQELERLSEVRAASVVMGTPANLGHLRDAGFDLDEPSPTPQPNDLVVAIDATREDAIERAVKRLQTLLAGEPSNPTGPIVPSRPRTLDEAIGIDADISLALISVPGTYAVREARHALQRGLHVFLFSDNVSIEDEIALKEEAIRRDLLMMGPDCGTAILQGAPLGFANAVRRGRIGIVGASGTGIQETSSLIHRLGGGISHAIGTGGRDLSDAVDGRMTRFGIDALANDKGTDILVVVSKAPGPAVARRVIDSLRASGKPAVIRFVTEEARAREGNVRFAKTLAEAAQLACFVDAERAAPIEPPPAILLRSPTVRSARGQRMCGLFAGGTLAQEAWEVLVRAGVRVRSNVAADRALRIEPGAPVDGHTIWDLGADAFTVGRPHPMIEPSLRDEEIVRRAEDPTLGILLVDCVLGHGAHPDPAASLAAALRRVGDRSGGLSPIVVASVTGTDEDPQRRAQQVAALVDAGVLVAPSNAAAASWVAAALRCAK